MKYLTTDEETILVHDTAATSQKMSVALSGKAFQILAAGLYKNRIRAIIRELSTNAWDSHMEAGNPNAQFDIQLPTNLNPIFYIRDYGTGMDEHTVFNIYNKLFESTKTATNSQVGMLGLGAKTPFAYTDTVTITSIQGGKLKTYSSVLDAQRIPTMSKVYEADTNEADGLKVQFAVTSSDCREFVTEAEHVFSTFLEGPQPNFLNGQVNVQQVKEICPELYYGPRKGSSYGIDLYIIQGNIAYPTEQAHFDKKAYEETFGSIKTGSSLYLKVPIGTIDFQPSREGLTGSKDNYAPLTPLLFCLKSELTKHFTKEFVTVTSELEAKAEHRKREAMPAGFPIYSLAFFCEVLEAKGIPSKNVTGKGYRTEDLHDLLEKLEVEIQGGVSRSSYSTNRVEREYSEHDKTTKLNFPDVFETLKNSSIILVDDKKKYRSKIKHHFANSSNHCRIIVKASQDYPKLAQQFVAALPGFPVIKTSTMVDPPSAGKLAQGGPPVPKVKNRWFAKFNDQANWESTCADTMANSLQPLSEFGLSDTDVFYVISMTNGCVQNMKYLKGMVKSLRDAKVLDADATVLAAPSNKLDEITDTYSQAVLLENHVRDYVKKLYKPSALKTLAETSSVLNREAETYFNALFAGLKVKELRKHLYGDIYESFLTDNKDNLYNSVGYSFSVALGIDNSSAKGVLTVALADLKAKYPLVGELQTYRLADKILANARQLLRRK